jgi:N-acetyl-anhydromuramyl-L-alanine amidase AmpD
MVINETKYLLDKKNYYDTEFEKRQIVLANTFSDKDKHIEGWKLRMGGEYKKTTPFTIFRNGEINKHYDSSKYSDFLGSKSVDKKVIVILLENQGWLEKDLIENSYFNWVGNIYKRKKSVYEKRWRGFAYWDSYTNKQIESTLKLVNHLCEIHNIPKKCVGHNTFIDGIEYFEGVVYRSNYFKESTDLNPSWDFKKFKQLLEEKK